MDLAKHWSNPVEIKEIHRLHEMLLDAGVEHEWIDRRELFDPDGILAAEGFNHDYGWQVRVCDAKGKRIVSAIQGWCTYGVECDRIEIAGLLTPEEREHDSVAGYLTAEEVFERIMKAEGVAYCENA